MPPCFYAALDGVRNAGEAKRRKRGSVKSGAVRERGAGAGVRPGGAIRHHIGPGIRGGVRREPAGGNIPGGVRRGAPIGGAGKEPRFGAGQRRGRGAAAPRRRQEAGV